MRSTHHKKMGQQGEVQGDNKKTGNFSKGSFARLFIALRLTTSSVRIVLVLGGWSFLLAMLICCPVGSRFAWAQGEQTVPTFHFHVDRLEVETKEEGEPPTEVIVRNRDVQGNDLEFTVEVQDVKGIVPAERVVPAKDAVAEVPQLGFEEEELSLRLKPPRERVNKRCELKTGRIKGVNPEKQLKSKQTTRGLAFVSNDGDKKLTGVRFTADVRTKRVALWDLWPWRLYHFFGTETVKVPVSVCSKKGSVGSSSDQAFNLWIEANPPSRWDTLEPWAFSGYLTVSADGKAKPGRVKLTLIDTAPPHKNPHNYLLILTLLITLILAVIYLRKYRAYHKVKFETKPMLPLDLGKSPASKIAAAGAILGTILSASVLPEATFLMPKEHFASLNVLFGLLVAAAAVVHNYRQRVWSYLCAAALIVGTALGQILTTIFLFEEIGIQGSMTSLSVGFAQLLLVGAMVVMVLWVANPQAIGKVLPPPDPGDRTAAQAAARKAESLGNTVPLP